MDNGETKKRKRSKNIAVLLLIFGWVLLIWLVTMVRIAQAAEVADDQLLNQATRSSEIVLAQTETSPVYDLDRFFAKGRDTHQGGMAEQTATFTERGENHLSEIDGAADQMAEEGAAHQGKVAASDQQFQDNGAAHQQEMDEMRDQWHKDGSVHQATLAQKPESWWESWKARLLPDDYGTSKE